MPCQDATQRRARKRAHCERTACRGRATSAASMELRATPSSLDAAVPADWNMYLLSCCRIHLLPAEFKSFSLSFACPACGFESERYRPSRLVRQRPSLAALLLSAARCVSGTCSLTTHRAPSRPQNQRRGVQVESVKLDWLRALRASRSQGAQCCAQHALGYNAGAGVGRCASWLSSPALESQPRKPQILQASPSAINTR